MAYSPISKAHNIIECMKESNLLYACFDDVLYDVYIYFRCLTSSILRRNLADSFLLSVLEELLFLIIFCSSICSELVFGEIADDRKYNAREK